MVSVCNAFRGTGFFEHLLPLQIKANMFTFIADALGAGEPKQLRAQPSCAHLELNSGHVFRYPNNFFRRWSRRTMAVLMSVVANLAEIRERIARAAKKAGRNPEEIALLAVTKTQPAEWIIEAYEAGQRLFGENRVQEFGEKYEALAKLRGAEEPGSAGSTTTCARG